MHLGVRAAAAHAHPARVQHCDLAHRVDLRACAAEPAVRHARVDERGRDDADGIRAVRAVRGRAGNREREFLLRRKEGRKEGSRCCAVLTTQF